MIFFQRFTALSRHYTIYNFIQEKLVNINKNTGMQTSPPANCGQRSESLQPAKMFFLIVYCAQACFFDSMQPARI